MSTDIKPPAPVTDRDWDIHTHQDQELVKGLGLTSATMLVMGSMIGSGIFIVSAEIAREVEFSSTLDRRLAGDRFHDHRRRAQLRRTRRHDAPRRRPIRLPPRIAWTPLGISLRMDLISRHSDRHHRSRWRRVRQVSRHLLSRDFFFPLDFAFLESARPSRSAPWSSATWMSD